MTGLRVVVADDEAPLPRAGVASLPDRAGFEVVAAALRFLETR